MVEIPTNMNKNEICIGRAKEIEVLSELYNRYLKGNSLQPLQESRVSAKPSSLSICFGSIGIVIIFMGRTGNSAITILRLFHK